MLTEISGASAEADCAMLAQSSSRKPSGITSVSPRRASALSTNSRDGSVSSVLMSEIAIAMKPSKRIASPTSAIRQNSRDRPTT